MKRAVLFVVVLQAVAFGRIDANSPAAPGWDSFAYSAPKDLKMLPGQVWHESGETFLRMDNFTALALAGGASIALHNVDIHGETVDNRIANHFNSRPPWNNTWDDAFYTVGGPGFHFAATGLWYGLAAADKDDLNRQRAWTMMTALSITGATTLGLKFIDADRQPNEKHGMAWPSGHTASSFTVASVLDEFYGPQIGIPAYAAAGFVGYRMMASGDHWASDVVFGGVLGWIVGHSVAGRHKQLEIAGFELMPYISDGGEGLALVKKF